MAPAQKFLIQDNAYFKFFLHASKHPHASVIGLLVGPSSNPTDGECVVSDAIPLLHHWTNLSPMMEVGVQLARIYAKDSGLRILGLYQANENAADTTLSAVGYQVLDMLKADFVSPFALVFNQANIPEGAPALQIHMIQKPATGKENTFDMVDPTVTTKAVREVRERSLQAYLADFDDFLEDGTADWLQNSAVGR